ncbi:MAG TPA: hypothetical protein VNH11_19480 [Pirellulales bacterium]|nr:hypothetical protein [Pirellulales bacterium]
MAKKNSKKKPVKRRTAAAILARMHAKEAERQAAPRKEMTKKRRQEIKDKQRAAALRLWAPGGRLRKLLKQRKQDARQRGNAG